MEKGEKREDEWSLRGEKVERREEGSWIRKKARGRLLYCQA